VALFLSETRPVEKENKFRTKSGNKNKLKKPTHAEQSKKNRSLNELENRSLKKIKIIINKKNSV